MTIIREFRFDLKSDAVGSGSSRDRVICPGNHAGNHGADDSDIQEIFVFRITVQNAEMHETMTVVYGSYNAGYTSITTLVLLD